MHSSAERSTENKMKAANHFGGQAKRAAAVQLKDNRPESMAMQQQVAALADKQSTRLFIRNNSVAPVQRKISFTLGGQKTFKDIGHLKTVLKSMYAEKHHGKIDSLVDDAQAMKGFPVGAVDVYNQVRGIADAGNWERVIQALPSDGHGPSLPVLDAHETEQNREYAMSTFMFGSVTLARGELILPDGTLVPFEARNSDEDHAEVRLMNKMDEYMKSNKIDPKKCKLRITINNAPCGETEEDCAGKLSAYAEEKGFYEFHLYYMNAYGKSMEKAVTGMRSKNIKVSNFAPKSLGLDEDDYEEGTWQKIQSKDKIDPANIDLDDWSGDESSSKEKKSSSSMEEEKEEDKGGSGKGKRESRRPERESSLRKRERSRDPLPRSKKKYPSLDAYDEFEDVADMLTNANVVELDATQVRILIQMFGNDPSGEIVTINDAEFRISRTKKGARKSKYNPDGVSLVIRRFFRGG